MLRFKRAHVAASVVAALIVFGALALVCVSRFGAASSVPSTESASASAKDPVESLQPLGPLSPAPQGEAEQKRVLEAIRRALETAERQPGFDAYLHVVKANSEVYYEKVRKSETGSSVSPLERGEVLGPIAERVRWATSGPKARYEFQRIWGGGTKPWGMTQGLFAYDGNLIYEYHPDDREGIVRPGERLDDGPSFVGLLNQWTITTYSRQPLSSLFPSSGVRYEGRQTVGEVDCLKVTAPLPHAGLDVEIWISPEHGYRAKRLVETSVRHDGRQSYWVEEVESFESHNGFWFPRRGTEIRTYRDDQGREIWEGTTEWRVIALKAEAPDCLFRLDFPLGTRVSDMTGKEPRAYTVGGDLPRLPESATAGR